MAAFLGDIAFLFGILVTAAGLLVLHRAGGDPRPVILKTAGILLLAAGIGTALCTGYYWMKYHFAGDLEHPYPPGLMSKSTMKGQMRGMQMGDMMGGMMGGAKSGGMGDRGRDVSEAGPEPGSADPSEAEHEEHHPEVSDDASR